MADGRDRIDDFLAKGARVFLDFLKSTREAIDFGNKRESVVGAVQDKQRAATYKTIESAVAEGSEKLQDLTENVEIEAKELPRSSQN